MQQDVELLPREVEGVLGWDQLVVLLEGQVGFLEDQVQGAVDDGEDALLAALQDLVGYHCC